MEEEKAAYGECLADLEGAQRKLKAVKVQLNAARAEAEGVREMVFLKIKSLTFFAFYVRIDSFHQLLL